MSGVGRPLAIWLQIDQIFCLAPSIRPPMLPVVSRQKTTSTFGFLSAATAAGAADRPAQAASRAAVRNMDVSSRSGCGGRLSCLTDGGRAGEDLSRPCNAAGLEGTPSVAFRG